MCVEKPHPAGELLPAGDLEAQIEAFVADYNHCRLPREHRQSNAGRRLLRTRPDNPAAERKDQTPDHHTTPLAAPTASGVTSSTEPEPPLICTARCLKNFDDGHCGAFLFRGVLGIWIQAPTSGATSRKTGSSTTDRRIRSTDTGQETNLYQFLDARTMVMSSSAMRAVSTTYMKVG
jgi:hypothetical protein